MKKFSLFVVFMLVLNATAFAQTGIKFEHSNWKTIVQKAKKENKLIFMDAYTTWCGPCKMLQADVFPNKELGDLYNVTFVNVKMDMESPEGEQLAAIYPLKGYPTMFFIDPNTGKVVNELLGYDGRTLQNLINYGKKYSKKKA